MSTTPTGAELPYLRLLERAARVVEERATLADAAGAVIADVCREAAWPVGLLAMVAGGSASPPAVWHASEPDRFRILRQVLTASPWPGGAAIPEAAADAGLGAAVAFPVRSCGEQVAELQFFLERGADPDPAMVEAVTAVALQLGRMADRRRAAVAEEENRMLLERVNDAFVRLGPDGAIVEWNRQAELTFGWLRSEALGRRLGELVVPLRSRGAHEAALARVLSGTSGPVATRRELTAVHRSGTEFPVEVTLWSTALDGSVTVHGFVRDVSERKSFEGQLARQAVHDRLTGLPNRVLLRDRLEHALARAERQRTSVALLLLDLDRFKVVNDSLGHDGGDQLLVQVAARLSSALRPGDTLARMGGDEYAVLCEDVETSGEAVDVARLVARVLEAPFVVRGTDISVTMSVGVAVSAAGEHDADLLLRDADVAMYQAKRRGRGRHQVFSEDMRSGAPDRLSVENDLRRAVRHNQLMLFYQPIVRLDRAEIVGFEALVRWDHPRRGLLGPGDFIPQAEESGLIVPLGRSVLDQACVQAVAWERGPAQGRPLSISVNVSARQLAHPGWAEEVAEVLDQTGMEPRRLALEITESVLMADPDTTATRLEELRRLGVRIAIDDFGTGYSSLGYLRRLPVDVLKIDKTFIDGVAQGPHESALARAVIKLASTLKLEAVAEGVSTAEQVQALRRLRCPYGQGFHFARPQPAEAVPGLLASGPLGTENSLLGDR
ncbi:MAG: EAL domain-containing protein [Actinomycetota bacterium]|nr:EAL domain-containing protein [Actinomycetota bacterium]